MVTRYYKYGREIHKINFGDRYSVDGVISAFVYDAGNWCPMSQFNYEFTLNYGRIIPEHSVEEELFLFCV